MAWTPVSAGRWGSLCCHLVTVTRSGQAAVWRLAAGSDQVRLVSYWPLPDPDKKNEPLSHEERLAFFREARDEIRRRLVALAASRQGT